MVFFRLFQYYSVKNDTGLENWKKLYPYSLHFKEKYIQYNKIKRNLPSNLCDDFFGCVLFFKNKIFKRKVYLNILKKTIF